MESPDDEPSLTCQVELRDMRSEQHDAAGEYVNAVEVALHSVEGGSLDSVEATVSWYAQAVVLAFAFDPEGTGGLAGPLPYELDDHFIQAQVLDEHGALEVEVHVEALKDGQTKCQDHLTVPFSQWDEPEEMSLTTALSISEGISLDKLESSFEDTLALQTVTDETGGNASYVLLRDLLGDVLGVYEIDSPMAAEVVSQGNQPITTLNAADLWQGSLIVMTDSAVDLHRAVLLRFDPLGGALESSYDTTDFAGDYDGEMLLHNKFYIDANGAVHALDWRYRKAGKPAYSTNMVEISLDEETLTILEVVERFDSANCTTESECDYGNAVGLSSQGYQGQRLQVATFAIDRSAEGGESELERSFFVAGLPGEEPRFIFIRSGYGAAALSDSCLAYYPDMQVIELPDLPDAKAAMDFLHDAGVRQVGRHEYQISVLSLGGGDRESFVSFYTLQVPQAPIPAEPVQAELVCSSVLDEKTLSYGNLYTLPHDRFDPQFSITYVFPGASDGPITGYSGQPDEAGGCEVVFVQTVGESSGAAPYQDKWMEPISAGDLVGSEATMKVAYDFDLLGEVAKDLGLFF